MQASVGNQAVNAVSKLLPKLRVGVSSFVAPKQDVLRPARGILYAVMLALALWAALGALILGWVLP